MPTSRPNYRPAVEALEERRTPSAAPPLGVPAPAFDSKSGADAGAAVRFADTLATLDAFTRAYLSHVGQPNYDPVFDLNHNGQIGQDDGRLLLRILPPVGPKVPLTLKVTLAPRDKARGHVPTNSGGVTHRKEPTVLGRTTPGALIFTGTGTVDLKLRGPAYVADARGNFAVKVNLTDGINQFDLQAVDRYGQQTLRAFPIYWLDFARYEAAHPAKK